MKDKMILKLERDRLLTKNDTMNKTVSELQRKITGKTMENSEKLQNNSKLSINSNNKSVTNTS